MKLVEKRTKETYIFNYTSKENQSKFKSENYEDSQKSINRVTSIEDFSMDLYGKNNQIITLQRKFKSELYGIEGNILGMNALIRKGKLKGYKEFAILLYLPEGSNEFVIIRK